MAGVGRGFDRMARWYDSLARLVYGRSIVRAQVEGLPAWPEKSRVLIVGGGTGWFLEEVLRQANPDLVVYVELSQKMLEKSRERIAKVMPEKMGRVRFIHGKIEDLETPLGADVVCTHFYLDMFEGAILKQEIHKLKRHLKVGGNWSLVDFRQVPQGWMNLVSGFLIWLMYRFFRGFTGIQARKLEDFVEKLSGEEVRPIKESLYYRGMIQAVWLKKESD